MTHLTDNPIAAPSGYAQWAASYETENVVTTLDQLAVERLSPGLQPARLLDAGCGTGRRLRGPEPEKLSRAVGMDLVCQMLKAGTWAHGPHRPVNADVTALPFASGSFDTVWCRLVLGHVEALEPTYRELYGVLDEGGMLITTDFHPAAAAAGHQRTFENASVGTRSLTFHPHSLKAHVGAATSAGLEVVDRCELGVGPEVRSFYKAAGRLARYEADLGLPLVFGLMFRRPPTR